MSAVSTESPASSDSPATSSTHAEPESEPLNRRNGPRLSWPRSFAALQIANYRIYFASELFATTGLWMQRIAQDWLIMQLTGSATAVGLTVACQFLPMLFFGMFGGLLADRFPKRRVLMVTQSVAASMAILLGILAITGVVEAWHVFAIATMLGFVTVVDNPTRQAFVPELVGDAQIRNAVSLNSSVFQLGRLLGPALSGALIHAVGQGPSFLINGGACLTVVTLLATMKLSDAMPARTGDAGRSVRREVTDGITYIRNTPEIGWTIVLVTAAGLFGLNMPVVLSAFAKTVFTGGVGGYSLFNSLVAIGALTGALLSAQRNNGPRLRLLVGCLIALGLGLAGAALLGAETMFCVMLVGIGMVTLVFLTSANSLVQLTAPPQVRGRVMSVYLLMLLGTQAVGGPMTGSMIDAIGARPAMLLCGLLLAGVTALAGIGMARQGNLRLTVNRRYRRVPLQIVQR